LTILTIDFGLRIMKPQQQQQQQQKTISCVLPHLVLTSRFKNMLAIRPKRLDKRLHTCQFFADCNRLLMAIGLSRSTI